MHHIKVSITYEKKFWIGLFERQDDDLIAVAKHIFGQEPTDPEIYDFILQNYQQLKFSKPVSLDDLSVKIKRKNPKRLKREARKEVEKAEKYFSHAQDVLRQSIEENKKERKILSKEEKETQRQERFAQKQARKKEKRKGH